MRYKTKLLRFFFGKTSKWQTGFLTRNDFERTHVRGTRMCRRKEYPALSATEENEIRTFWETYGIQYPNYDWYRMFYAETGTHDPRFVPDSLARIIAAHLNNREVLSGWDDKNMYSRLVPNLRFPEELCHGVNGNLYDREWNLYSNNETSRLQLAERIFDQLQGDESVIWKQARDSFAGQGVKKFTVKNATDIAGILEAHGDKDFVLQKCIRQHPFLSQFNASSVNIFRITTLRHRGEYHLLSASIRFGTEGYATDVAYIDGQEIVHVVGLDSNGEVHDQLFGFDGKQDFAKYTELKIRQVPNYEQLIQTAIKGHGSLPHFNLISWDFTLDEEGNPICIEYNINRPGSLLYQLANGPLFGEFTEDILPLLKKEEVLQAIPEEYRIKQ